MTTDKILDPTLGEPVLDNASWAALTGPHEHLAQRVGLAARYHPEVARFVGLSDHRDPQAWRDLAELIGPGGTAALDGVGIEAPSGWTRSSLGAGIQFVAVDLRSEFDPALVRLGAEDVPEMLDLVSRTQPGPFLPRTVEMARYVGLRENGVLIAMAGERLKPPGWTEISAVCTDPAHRGRGLATRLVRDVAAGIVERGDRVLLHTFAANAPAISLYESIGFRARRRKEILLFTAPTD